MANELQKLSEELAAAVEKVSPSTVSVDARGRTPATGIVWSADGEILTADHVVKHDDKITIITADGAKQAAKVLGRDPASDLALLKAEGSGLAVPQWSEAAKVGHLILAVGRPDDLQATVGSVVSIGGPVRGHFRYLEAYLQSDVTMFPGFSGGPMIDVSGRVLGLNSSALARGASLAVPVAAARKVADALRQHGRIRRGFLGVSTQPVMLAESVAQALDQRTGLMIIGTEKGGPAEKGGLMQGDVIVGVGGAAVTDIESLQAALGPETVGRATQVKVVRGGNTAEVSLTVGERPSQA